MQAGATLGSLAFRDLMQERHSCSLPSERAKVKDDEATALMRRRLQMLREQNMMYD